MSFRKNYKVKVNNEWIPLYIKPDNGIPDADIENSDKWNEAASSVEDSEKVSNKVTSLSSSSTDDQYPSAKCVYDLVGDIESALDTLLNGG